MSHKKIVEHKDVLKLIYAKISSSDITFKHM